MFQTTTGGFMPPSNDTLLCVDLSYQVYRATCANPRLTSGDTFTGGLYGFFMFLGKAVRECDATRLAFCLDTKPYRRSAEYPKYKQVRKARQDPEVKAKYETSKNLVLETLFNIRAPIYACEGFEADDIEAGLALRNRHRLRQIVIATNDSDPFQLLWMDNLSIYKTDYASRVTGRTLQRDYGLTPEQFMLATALQGTHNDVEGIPGVGEKTAVAAVKDFAKLRALRGKWADLIDRNVSLIRLPHRELPHSVCLLEPPRNAFNPRDLYRALGVYDIDVTESMVRAFEQTGV
jgi:DNA polymerase-1